MIESLRASSRIGRIGLACVVVSAVACSSSSGSSSSPYVAGFNPPAAADGYTRYVTPVIRGLAAGQEKMYCQWLAAPGAADQDALEVTGSQSKGGHHIVLYATTAVEAIGTSRECTIDDMLSVRYLGSIGGEGSGGLAHLPEGVAVRLQKGELVMANTHFINTGSSAIDGQGVVDVKWAAPSTDRQIAAFFTNVATVFDVPPKGVFTKEMRCTAQIDMPLILFANHMHNFGKAAFTEIVRGDGTSSKLADDQTWTSEQQFNPHFASFPLAQPTIIHKGDVVHTSCTWANTADTALSFPTEMCAGFGFYLAPKGTVGQEVHCVDGSWH